MVGTEAAEKMSVNEEKDLISTLPDSVLVSIISLLPCNEGVRTCVLSNRWKTMWKHVPHLSLDQSKMLKLLIRAYLRGLYLSTRLEMAYNRRRGDQEKDFEDLDEIAKAEVLIDSVLDSHVVSLESCTIRHLPESCASGKAVMWIEKLLKQNKVKKLSMERDDTDYLGSEESLPRVLRYHGRTLDLPFKIFSGFEALELKNYFLKTSPSSNDSCQVLTTLAFRNMSVKKDAWEGILSCCLCLENLTLENVTHDNCKLMREVTINSPRLKFLRICRMQMNGFKVSAVNLEVFEIDTVVCMPKRLLTFEIPKVHLLRSRSDLKIRGQYICWVGSKLLQSRNILHTSSQSHQGTTSSFAGIFENLATLCIDFDLKTVKNAITLFSALKACPKLQNLEINSEINDNAVDYYDQHDEDDAMEYYRRKEPCECIDQQLKTLSIMGFAGKKTEVEFLKYVITNGEVMKKITIWFVDDCSWIHAAETGCLLSFQTASPNLSIILNPGPFYMANVGGNFETWLSTLRE
ncbi:hypothetical protein AAZX31_13G266600 [Glycine max]|uniref:At1g61320/AtMIF1 LRR domain-containing protein n=2 Tax=Glycine subgen. Soja TaxID=1462606 RepID=K7M2F4_SOYBN|nr:F-box protein At1g80960 [Glycine max]XP_028190522.1 F-box protein At1g80960-like [Glycine soja]KAG4960861.1 hypothetical protein JHK87_037494 [Glycine soja]KAG4971870.1 hypothetical protein JHK85_038291 [Glycine max]KAG4978265.1 hypothetical protein JHK86_037739 [Glycine max]KAG5114273.1 hypothetical protein JHK82_037542 [Glycine max]KAG5131554.1 hypothetical protein JHK84_037951 [Glycine max]|eukprot:XP_003543276.2 F-box protein At1g80960 [Glycine max]